MSRGKSSSRFWRSTSVRRGRETSGEEFLRLFAKGERRPAADPVDQQRVIAAPAVVADADAARLRPRVKIVEDRQLADAARARRVPVAPNDLPTARVVVKQDEAVLPEVAQFAF